MSDEDIEVVLVPKPSREEIGRLLCDLLSRYGYIGKLKQMVRSAGISISDEKISELLREFCPELYYHVKKENRKRYFLKRFFLR